MPCAPVARRARAGPDDDHSLPVRAGQGRGDKAPGPRDGRQGARDLNRLKTLRCGMGACGGKTCQSLDPEDLAGRRASIRPRSCPLPRGRWLPRSALALLAGESAGAAADDGQPYDVIIIGAGSVGPADGLLPRPGEGQGAGASTGCRRRARARTRPRSAASARPIPIPPKIQTCHLSLEVFATGRSEYGDDIHFRRGGYCFPVYEEEHERSLKTCWSIQKQHGLNIDWLDGR